MKIYKFSEYLIVLFSFAGIFIAVFTGKSVRVILETIDFVIISGILINNSHAIKCIKIENTKYLMWFFYFGILIFIHSCFIAEDYDQWRYLFTTYLPILILPWIAILSSDPVILKTFIKKILTLAIPLSFVFFLLGLMKRNENFSYVNYVSFVYLLILIIPYVKFNWKILIIGISILSLMFNLSNRTNVLCILLSYFSLSFIVLIKYTTGVFVIPILKLLRLLFFFIPLLLCVLAYTDTFDVFTFLEVQEAEKIANSDDVGIATDSRSGIYKDAVGAIKTPYDLLFGTSPVYYYETHLAETYVYDGDYDKGRLGGAEAAILNFLQWGGITFTMIVFIIFWTTSALAIFKSNSLFLKLIGLSICIRWFLLFIELPINMNFTWFAIFMMLGISLSPKFRSMTDSEIKSFFYSV